jgi:hypothetical protein
MSNRYALPRGPERGKLHVELASVTSLIWGKAPAEAARILDALQDAHGADHDTLVIENANEGYRQDDYLFLYGERMETGEEYEQRQADERWEAERTAEQRRQQYEALRAEFEKADAMTPATGSEAGAGR